MNMPSWHRAAVGTDTMLDALQHPELSDFLGIDVNQTVELVNQHHATLQVEDPSQDWSKAPDRYLQLGLFMAKVFTITVPPKLGNKRRERTTDPRYVDGQRLLVEAMKYLAQADPVQNRPAIELISEHVRTRFRMSDSPLG